MNPFITGKYVILNGLDANDAQNEQWFGLSNDRNIAFNSPNMYRLPNNSEKQLSYFNTLKAYGLYCWNNITREER